jgi:hypothetical protein
VGWLILISLILTLVTEPKENINRIYIGSWAEYITSTIQIPPHPIYYKRIEIPPIHLIFYITKWIPFPPIGTSSGITKRIQQN